MPFFLTNSNIKKAYQHHSEGEESQKRHKQTRPPITRSIALPTLEMYSTPFVSNYQYKIQIEDLLSVSCLIYAVAGMIRCARFRLK